MKKPALALTAIAMLSACATQPENIEPASVPTSLYLNSTCAQLDADLVDLVSSVEALTAAQKQKATGDAVAMGVGLVLFWPAALAIAVGSDKQAELAQAKGQYDAIQRAKVMKGCPA